MNRNNHRFEGKTAIVTGAGQGMGKAIAMAFAAEGANVVVNDLHDEVARQVADEVTGPGRALPVAADVSKRDQVEAMVAAAVSEFGAVDILVNNAGVLFSTPVEEISEAEWDTVMNVNLKAVFLCSLAVLPGMDRYNTDSLRPRLQDLWLVELADRERLAATPYGNLFVLAGAEAAEVAGTAAVTSWQAHEWIAAARLATLRGIGTENARLMWDAGIFSVAQLAASEPGELGPRLRSMTGRPRAATPPKVRVWVAAARQVTGEGRWSRATR